MTLHTISRVVPACISLQSMLTPGNMIPQPYMLACLLACLLACVHIPSMWCRSPESTQLSGAPSEESADVWSLACAILYMFTQTIPFDNMTSFQICAALQAGRIPAIPDSLPLDLQRMLRQCFTWPNTRSTAALMALKLQVTSFAAARSCCLDAHVIQSHTATMGSQGGSLLTITQQ